jgi:hypothetical protein
MKRLHLNPLFRVIRIKGRHDKRAKGMTLIDLQREVWGVQEREAWTPQDPKAFSRVHGLNDYQLPLLM